MNRTNATFEITDFQGISNLVDRTDVSVDLLFDPAKDLLKQAFRAKKSKMDSEIKRACKSTLNNMKVELGEVATTYVKVIDDHRHLYRLYMTLYLIDKESKIIPSDGKG